MINIVKVKKKASTIADTFGVPRTVMYLSLVQIQDSSIPVRIKFYHLI